MNFGKWGILGGGFGLYGHLPALMSWGCESVVIPVRYKPFCSNRPELKAYTAKIIWADDDAEVISAVDSLILAIAPASQSAVIKRLSRRYKAIVLEKPLAQSCEIAPEVLESSIASAEVVRVNYSFLHTSWVRVLKRLMGSPENYRLRWAFMAHHYKTSNSTWKALHEAGGGALRFYGIHIVAVLASCGLVQAKCSVVELDEKGGVVMWRAAFYTNDKVCMEILVDTRSSQSIFELSAESKGMILSIQDPFSEFGRIGDQDSRVVGIIRMLDTLGDSNETYYSLYCSVNQLWAQVERLTVVK